MQFVDNNIQEEIGTSEVVLVDSNDVELGVLGKADAHVGMGHRHRAFSLWVFKDQRLLVQKRASVKPLWPGYWANSCCSHPRQKERIIDAARRRAVEELRLAVTDLQSIFAFEYHARFKQDGAWVGSEHEYCHIVFGQTKAEPFLDEAEVDEFQWLSRSQIEFWMNDEDMLIAPWFRSEWQLLLAQHIDTYTSMF